MTYPHILTDRPNPTAPQGCDNRIFLCQWSRSRMRHIATGTNPGSAHPAATRQSLDRFVMFSPPFASEPV